MIFTETPLDGALPDRPGEARRRTWLFRSGLLRAGVRRATGLPRDFVQANNSLSAQKGTLRGMHYQLAPKAETKVVRCLRGALHDVILDMREGSPTFGQSFGAELTAENRRMMYVPKGFGHGILHPGRRHRGLLLRR